MTSRFVPGKTSLEEAIRLAAELLETMARRVEGGEDGAGDETAQPKVAGEL